MYKNEPNDIMVHYRLYQHEGQVHVVCVQNFDYVDYDESKFVNDEYYLWEEDAERAILILENPDKYIPENWETHYRILTDGDSILTVIEIGNQSEYENYGEEQFYNETFYRTEEEAKDIAYWGVQS